MKTVQVDAMGDTCPIPVVKTKNAIKALGVEGGILEILVDNEIAVQNLMKMADIKGYKSSQKMLSTEEYIVEMTIDGGM